MRTLWTHYLPELTTIAQTYRLPILTKYLNTHKDVGTDNWGIQDFFWQNVKVTVVDWDYIMDSPDFHLIDDVPWTWVKIVMRKKSFIESYDFERFDADCTYFMDLWLTMVAVMMKVIHVSGNEELAVDRTVFFMSVWSDIREFIDNARCANDHTILDNIHYTM